MIYNMSCTKFLGTCGHYKLIFADPPDNIGLGYDGFDDNIPDYYNWLFKIMVLSLMKSDVFWLSYNQVHTLQLVPYVNRLTSLNPTIQVRQIIWRYTFGQYNESDCGSGFRPMFRFLRSGATLYPDAIRVKSTRQALGDSRADPRGRVPDDVWEIPRVVGNSKERQPWHPTQHPESLLERIILFCTRPGDTILDLFGGTGTTATVAGRLGRKCDTCEINPRYCRGISIRSGDELAR